MTDPEDFIYIFGEQWRILIISSLKWLDKEEPKWNLPRPMNKYEFLRDLIDGAKK